MKSAKSKNDPVKYDETYFQMFKNSFDPFLKLKKNFSIIIFIFFSDQFKTCLISLE